MRLIVLVSIAKAVGSMRPMQKTMQKALRKAVAPTAAAIALLGCSPAANAALRDAVVELSSQRGDVAPSSGSVYGKVRHDLVRQMFETAPCSAASGRDI